MTIRHALFIDGAWTDSGGETYTALVTVYATIIEIRPHTDGITDAVRFTLAEFAALAEMVARHSDPQQEPQP